MRIMEAVLFDLDDTLGDSWRVPVLRGFVSA